MMVASILRHLARKKGSLDVGDDFGLEALDLGGRGVEGELDQGIELFRGLFVFVPLTRETDAHSVGDVPHAGLPDVLVHSRVYSHVRRLHHQRREFLRGKQQVRARRRKKNDEP